MRIKLNKLGLTAAFSALFALGAHANPADSQKQKASEDPAALAISTMRSAPQADGYFALFSQDEITRVPSPALERRGFYLGYVERDGSRQMVIASQEGRFVAPIHGLFDHMNEVMVFDSRMAAVANQTAKITNAFTDPAQALGKTIPGNGGSIYVFADFAEIDQRKKVVNLVNGTTKTVVVFHNPTKKRLPEESRSACALDVKDYLAGKLFSDQHCGEEEIFMAALKIRTFMQDSFALPWGKAFTIDSDIFQVKAL